MKLDRMPDDVQILPAPGRGDGRNDSQGTAAPSASRRIWGLAAFCAAYALCVQVGFWFRHAGGGAAFFPGAGLALAVLVLTPRRTWPLWLAALATADVALHLAHHVPVEVFVWACVADVVEPVAGALLLVAAMRHVRGPRSGLVAFAALPVALAPWLGAVIGASAIVAHSPVYRTWWVVTVHWWIADALGVLVIGSLVLAWARPIPFDDPVPVLAVAGVAVVGAGAILVTGVLWEYPLVYIVLPALVWAAFVGRARAVTAVGAAAALAADWVARTDRAERLLGSARAGQQLEFLQLFLAVTFLSGLVLAVEILERRRSEHRTLQVERARAASEEAAVRLAEAERRSIAQDTHDIVGHGLSVMLLQLGAVRKVLDRDPAEARGLISSVESIGRKACEDLDVSLALIGPMHGSAAGHGLDDVPELLETVNEAGLRVDLCLEGERRETTTLVDWSAYRIVREALTNVLKHAPAASATVTIRFDDDALFVSVIDDGNGRSTPAAAHDGRGIIGMRDRARALGGTVVTRERVAGGFEVLATLPTARSEAT